MRVKVLYFGVLREAFHTAGESVELPGEPCTVAELLDQLRRQADPRVQPLWPRLAVAVNYEYAAASHGLRDGDEVALLPPVSGGVDETPGDGRVLLTHAPLDPSAVAALKAGEDGAVVVFDGIVRNHTRSRTTRCLVYEAYEPMALRQMRSLLGEARTRFAIRDALLHHRLGRLEVGETSVLIAVAAAHRAAAFEGCRWLIDTLKQTVPIWKQEHFTDGVVWADGEPFPETLQPTHGESQT